MSFWRGRKALVTGGAGFIGRHVALRLAALGAEVRAVDSFYRGSPDDLDSVLTGVELLRRDLLDPEECQAACRGVEVVFHMASRVGPSSYYLQRPTEVLSTNVMIDTQMLRAAVSAGVERYFYPSSVFVYPARRQASPAAPPLKEEEAYPADPPVSYGWAKLLGEKMLEYAAGETPSFRGAVGRLIGVYGPGQDIDLERGAIIPVLLRRAYEYPKRHPFSIRGNGQETRSFCYVDDVVEAILATVEGLEISRFAGPINIGSEGRLTILELAREAIAVAEKAIEIDFLPGEPSVWGQAVDCSKARQLLGGWQPRVPLREGLRKTYDFVREKLTREDGTQ